MTEGAASNYRVLVGFDGSENSVDALAWAVDEAAGRGGDVEVFSVLHTPALAYSAGYLPPTPDKFRAEMEPLVAEALKRTGRDTAGPEVDLRVSEGYPAWEIADRAKEEDVGLVVVGARGHSRLTELMLGSVSHSLSHMCPKPLVIVPRGWAGAA
jgi:nucleotide-binding universal stress UspA family protein